MPRTHGKMMATSHRHVYLKTRTSWSMPPMKPSRSTGRQARRLRDRAAREFEEAVLCHPILLGVLRRGHRSPAGGEPLDLPPAGRAGAQVRYGKRQRSRRSTLRVQDGISHQRIFDALVVAHSLGKTWGLPGAEEGCTHRTVHEELRAQLAERDQALHKV